MSTDQDKLTFSKLTIDQLVENSFSQFQDTLFCSDIDKVEITYSEAQRLLLEIQKTMKAFDIKQGDRVAICSENHVHWGIVYLAITSMGAVAVPILPDFHSNEVHHILKHCTATALFASTKQKAKLDEDDFSSSLQTIFSIETLSVIENLNQSALEFVNEVKSKGVETLSQFKAKAFEFANIKAAELVIEETDLAAIIYTSGTTGQSKGVMLSHKNIIAQLQQTHDLNPIHKSDRFLSILPLAHTLECSVGFLVAFANGASVHYITKTPAPKVILKAMQKVKPTVMLTVPLIIEKIYKSKIQPNFNKNKLIKFLYNNVPLVRKKLNVIAGKKLQESFGGHMRFFGIGGAKLSLHVEDFLIEAKFPHAIGYGLTETAPLISGAIPFKTAVGTAGRIAMWIEYKFVKDDPEQKDGELHVRGPNVMMGYYKDKVRTAEVLSEDGWFNTGDLGYVDENEILTISGRSKNVIIGASGENIYPESIESVVNQIPIVLDSLVYELDGAVVAKIHLDYDQFDEEHNINSTTSETKKDILKVLEEVRLEANSLLSNYSKLTQVFEQQVPFIKTPTKKIKRYLHT